MEKRTLGQGLEVSAIGLGCMGMSEFYGARDEQEALETIHRALDLGVTFLDTADMYGPFTNEKLVARAISGRRDAVQLATKFGNVRGENGEWLGIRGDADYVRRACEASLARLGVDHIDLYYQHRVDKSTEIEETVGTMGELVERVREIAEEKDVTPAQLALAWVLRQGDDIVPIPGTKRAHYLEENARAAEVELSDEDLARIEDAFPKGATSGERYPDMSSIDR